MNPRDRDPGLEVLVRFAAVLRTGRAYSPTNQVFRLQLEAFAAALRPLLDAHGEVVLAAFEEGLYLNGARISTRAVDFRHYRALLEEFSRRDLGGLQVLGEAPPAEWQAFFELFLQPDRYRGAGFVQACAEHGLAHVVPALSVHQDAPPEDGEDPVAQGAGRSTGAAADEALPAVPHGPDAEAGRGAGRRRAAGTAGGQPTSDERLAGSPGAAPKRYAQALTAARSLLTSTTLQDGLEFRHVKRVVQPIVDDALAGRPVILGLAGLGRRDEFTYARSVNTCLVAVSIGQRLGLDRAALADLAVAALFHDVGRGATSDPARVGVESARRIAAVTRFGTTAVRCLEAALDGRAPEAAGPAGSERSLLARVVAIAGAYARLVSHRSEVGSAITPYQALGMVLGPLASRFEPALRLALVEALGCYPPGQLVELDGGQVAAVLAPGGADLAHPIVQVLSGPYGEPLPRDGSWEGGPLPPERRVLRALKAEEYPEFPAQAA